MAQQLVGYAQDGSPLYEIVPDGQPPLEAGEEPLPPMNNGMTLEELDAMSQGSGIDMRRDDLAAASGEVPQQVADDVAQRNPEVRRAEPALQNEGSYFDLSYIEQMRNAYQQALQQSGGDQQKAAAMVKPVWNSFTPVQKHVYQQAEGFASLDPKFAAGLAVKYHEDQKRVQEDANDPVRKNQSQLAEARVSALQKESKQEAQQLYKRASNMVWLLDNLRGGKPENVKDGSEKWRTRVGSVDGRWPSAISSEETLGWNADFNSLKGMINLNEAQGNKGQGTLTDSERVLMAQAASLGLEQIRDEKGFKAAFDRMYTLAQETEKDALGKLSGDGRSTAPAPAQSTPSMTPADTRKRTTLMGVKYAENPDGTLEKVAK